MNKPSSSVLVIMSAIAFGTVGACVPIVTPEILVSLIQQGIITPRQMSYIIACEMTGATLATFGISIVLPRVNWRIAGICFALLALIMDISSIFSSSGSSLALVRFLAGVSEGSLLALAVACISGTAAPERVMGIFIAWNMCISTLVIRAIPSLTLHRGAGAGFFGLMGMAALALALSTQFPSRTLARRDEDGNRLTIDKSRNATILVNLFGTLVFFSSLGAVWPLLGLIGGSVGLDNGAVAAALGNATIAGIIGSLLSSALGIRLGRVVPLATGSVVILCLDIWLLTNPTASSIWLIAGLFMGSWIFCVPYYVGMVAAADPAGQAAAYSMAVQNCGLAVGPLLASIAMHGESYRGSIAIGAALCVSALALMLCAGDIARRRKPLTASPQ